MFCSVEVIAQAGTFFTAKNAKVAKEKDERHFAQQKTKEIPAFLASFAVNSCSP